MRIDGELLARAVRLCDELRASMEAPVAGDAALQTSGGDARPSEAFLRRARSARPSRPPRVERGQLWVVGPEPGSRGARAMMLVTSVDGEKVRGFVAADDAWIACEGDVVLPGAETPHAEALVVLRERSVCVDRARLLHFVGSLPRDVQRRVLAVDAALRADRAVEARDEVSRDGIVGARNAARTLVRRRARTDDDRAVEWLGGVAVDDPEDPRIEARDVLAWATAWLEREAAPVVVAPAVRAGRPLDRMIARIGALLASLPPVPGHDAAAGQHALAGAFRGPGDETAYSSRFEVAVGASATAEVRVTAEPARLLAGANVVEADGSPCAGVRLTLRNAATAAEAIGEGDARGVVLPVAIAVRDAEPAEIAIEVRRPGGIEVIRLAL